MHWAYILLSENIHKWKENYMSRSPTKDIPYECRIIDPNTHEIKADPDCTRTSPSEKEIASWGHSRLKAADAAKLAGVEYESEFERT